MRILLPIFLTLTFSLSAANFDWQNAGTDISDPANWAGGPPSAGDTGKFLNIGNTNPTLSGGSTFEVDELIFLHAPIPAQTYFFDITGSGSTFNLVGTGTQAGIFNTSGNAQLFRVTNNASLVFQSNSNADAAGAGLVRINVGDSASSGTLIFQDQSASGSFIPVTITAVNGSSIIFNDQADAATTLFSVTQGSNLTFNDNATGNSCMLRLGAGSGTPSNGFLNFNGNSNPGDGSIIAAFTGSIINFNDNSNAGLATLSLGGGSILNFNNNSSGSTGENPFPLIGAADGSSITFNDQTSAAFSGFLLGDEVTQGSLSFLGSSSAAQSTMSAFGGSTVLFDDQSTANAAAITLGSNSNMLTSGNLLFSGSASANSAQINALEQSTVTFSGQSNADSSTITLNDTTVLNFLDSSIAANVQIFVDAGATVNFSQDNDHEFMGSIQGTGTVNKMGPSTCNVLADCSSFTGVASVQNGNLALNNAWGGPIAVMPGGTISGTGTILNDLIVSGITAPGNSIGTLVVNGNYAQLPNSTYQVQVDGTGQASLIEVLGAAAIAPDSTVSVTALGQLPANQAFSAPILEAAGGVSGTYTTLITSPLITASLSYDPNDVFLTFQNTLSLIPGTRNQRRIAMELQGIASPSAEEDLVLSELAILPLTDAQKALDQISAQQYGALIPFAELNNRKFIRRLYDPLRCLITRYCCCNDCCTPVTTWAESGYERTSVQGTRNARGLRATGYQISAGAFSSPWSDWTIGVGGSYASDHLRYHVGGRGHNQSGLGALYALWRPENYYILGDLVAGYSNQRVRRPIHVGSIHFKKRSRPEVIQSTLYLEMGKDCCLSGLLLQPFAGVECGYFHRMRIHEKSDFLSVHVVKKTEVTAHSRLGVHLTATGFSCLTLNVDVAWQYRFTSFKRRLRERFTTFGTPFSIDGLSYQRHSIDGAINLSYALGDAWEIYAVASAQGWQRASLYNLYGGVNFSW